MNSHRRVVMKKKEQRRKSKGTPASTSGKKKGIGNVKSNGSHALPKVGKQIIEDIVSGDTGNALILAAKLIMLCPCCLKDKVFTIFPHFSDSCG